MSDPQSSIPVPDETTPSVHNVTQYGMVMPDGSVTWEAVTVRGSRYPIKALVKGRSSDEWMRRDWSDHLIRKAKEANVNPYDYSNQHKIVQRQVILAVTDTKDADTLRPWPAPDPGQRPLPVGEAKPDTVPLPPLNAPWE